VKKQQTGVDLNDVESAVRSVMVISRGQELLQGRPWVRDRWMLARDLFLFVASEEGFGSHLVAEYSAIDQASVNNIAKRFGRRLRHDDARQRLFLRVEKILKNRALKPSP
jgi:hypothetical protein